MWSIIIVIIIVIIRQVKTSDIIPQRFGDFMTLLSRFQMRIKLIVNFILICNLDNGVMKSPKRREIVSLVLTCLCTTKSLFIRIVIIIM